MLLSRSHLLNKFVWQIHAAHRAEVDRQTGPLKVVTSENERCFVTSDGKFFWSEITYNLLAETQS